MSTDTMAWFDVPVAIDPIALRDQLAAAPALAALLPRFGPMWQPKAWSVEPAGEILGPGGLALRFEPGLAGVYHVLRFSSFAAAGPDHDLVRRAFHAIARCLGSDRAVITHELAPTSGGGAGVAGVIDALTRNVGPAATTYLELADAEHYGPRSWIVDTFADL